MPAEISSMSYLLYTLLGTGAIWLATKVARDKIVVSDRARSILA